MCTRAHADQVHNAWTDFGSGFYSNFHTIRDDRTYMKLMTVLFK